MVLSIRNFIESVGVIGFRALFAPHLCKTPELEGSLEHPVSSRGYSRQIVLG